MCLGIPGEVVSLHDDRGVPFATVRFGGITREVCLACAPDVAVGEWVLVHVGFAIARVDADEAQKTLAALAELGLEE